LPEMVGDGIGERLVGREGNVWCDGLAALHLKAGRLLPRQGKGHPEPRRGGQKIAFAQGHGFILLTVCAVRATANYSRGPTHRQSLLAKFPSAKVAGHRRALRKRSGLATEKRQQRKHKRSRATRFFARAADFIKDVADDGSAKDPS